jgi:hypothetical protein
MGDHPKIIITSPADGTITNITKINVTVSLDYNTPHYYHHGRFKRVKLLIENKVAAEYTFTGNTTPAAYTFSNIDVSEYVNRGYVNVVARAFHGSSDHWDDPYHGHEEDHTSQIKILIDTIVSQISDIRPIDGACLNNPRAAITAILNDTGHSHFNKNSIQINLNNEIIDGSRITRIIDTDDKISIQYIPAADLPEQEYTFSIQAKDNAGNTVKSGDSRFLIDLTPPAIDSVYPTDGLMFKTASTVIAARILKNTGSPLDVASIKVILDGNIPVLDESNISTDTPDKPSSAVISYPANNLLEGSHSFVIKAWDMAGNEVSSEEIHFNVDITSSVFSNVEPIDQSTLTLSAPDISADIKDTGGSHLNLKTLTVVLDNNPVVIDPQFINTGASPLPPDTVSFKYNTGNLPDGFHSIIIRIEDMAGNKSETAKINFIIDTTPPVIEKVFPDGVVEKNSLTGVVTIKVSDRHSGINLPLCSAYIKSNDNRIINLDIQESGIVPIYTIVDIHFGEEGQISNLGIGTHELHLKLTDAAGNSIEQQFSFEIKHAVPFNNTRYQVCRSITGIADNPATEPYILPPAFVYGQDMVVPVSGCISSAADWEFVDNNIKVITEKNSSLLKVIISAQGIWSTDTQVRKALAGSFKKILEAIESRETDILHKGTSYHVQTLIPRLIPLSNSEMFSWYCGMDRTLRSIQLLPGFRLRLSAAAFQYCGPGKDEINGMIPQGEIILPVVRKRSEDGNFVTCLDPLISELAPRGYSTGDDKLQGRIGGLFDLFTGGMVRRHLALIMPATIPSVFTDSAGRDEHVTLASADTRGILENGIKVCSNANASGDGCVLRYLQGRTAITVEFPFVLNGNIVFVPVGTTLRQVCDNQLFGFTPQMLKSGQVSWCRQWTAALEADSDTGDSVILKDVQWTNLGQATVPDGMDIGDTPLLPGDRIDIRVTK